MKKIAAWLDDERHFRWTLLAADLASVVTFLVWAAVLLRVLEAAG